ncbi:MAG: tRNA methyl transferase PRC-barrel domain-containing protein [Armatimonadota bacterium]
MALALPQIKGPVIDEHGDVIGEHRGIWSYTIGQRTRMMLRSTERKYVAQINPTDNTIRVAGYKSLLRRRVLASQLNILDNEQPLKGSVLLGKIRSTGELARCTVMSIDDQSITVEFEQVQFAPAPGQKLVLYDFDGRVVCGGTIQT